MSERLLGRLTTNAIVEASGAALAYNASRVGGLIQNLSTDKLFVKKGAGCSDSDFTAILVGGGAADDGFGGSFPVGAYTGVVSVYSAGTVRAVVSEDVA